MSNSFSDASSRYENISEVDRSSCMYCDCNSGNALLCALQA